MSDNLKGGVKYIKKKMSRKISKNDKPIGISKTNQIKNYENKYQFEEFIKKMFDMFKTNYLVVRNNPKSLDLLENNIYIKISGIDGIYKVLNITKFENPIQYPNKLEIEILEVGAASNTAILYIDKENSKLVQFEKFDNLDDRTITENKIFKKNKYIIDWVPSESVNTDISSDFDEIEIETLDGGKLYHKKKTHKKKTHKKKTHKKKRHKKKTHKKKTHKKKK